MRNTIKLVVLSLAFLLGGQAFAQVTTRSLAGGQGIFTPGQRTEMLARRAQMTGIDANVAAYKANPTSFDFDHWHNVPGNVPKDNPPVFDYSPIKNKDGYRDHFVDLAISAWLDEDLTEAALVVDYLIRHFNRDELDVSNGQATNTTNPTFGTQERFYIQDEVNPWFEFNAWVKKCMQSWILINDISGFSTSTANENLINEYFAYAADWAYSTMQFRMGYRGSNIEAYTFNSTGFNTQFNPNSRRTNPFLEDINGNPYTQYLATQSMGMQNTYWDWMDVIDLYGIHYNVTSYKDWIKNAWDFYLAAHIWPNGINMEMYRAYADRPNWGMFYTPVTLASMVKVAHGHAAAVLNGVPGVSDAGYFFDRTVTDGIEDLFPDHCCADTGDGTAKGLLLALQAHARFFAQGSLQSNTTEWGDSSNGGQRFYVNGQLIDGDNHYQFTNPFAVANAWYNDPILERAYKRQGEFSHIPTTGGQVMGAYSNDEGTLYKWGADADVIWREMESVMYGGQIANQAPVVTHPQGTLQNTAGNARYYDIEVAVGDSFTLQDANWTDNEDGSGTVANNQIRRLSDNATGVSISTASPETFEARFQYSDAAGITSTAYLYVIVNQAGNNCPTLVFSDAAGDPLRQTIKWGDTWVRPTVVAQDVEDGNSTNILESYPGGGSGILNGVVSDEDTEVGEYIVRYTFTDSDGCTVEQDYIVTVEPQQICATSLTPEAGAVNMIVGQVRSMNPTILPADRTVQAFGVSSSNEAIVRVDENGNIIAVSPGTVQIRQFTFDCLPVEEGFTTVNVIDLNQLAASVPYIIYLKVTE